MKHISLSTLMLAIMAAAVIIGVGCSIALLTLIRATGAI